MKVLYSFLILLFLLSTTYSQSISGIVNPSNANGSYTPDGTRNTKQSWVNANSYYVYWDSGYWVIDVDLSIGNNAEFYIINSDDTPPSTGYTAGTGQGSPTLTGFVVPVELTDFDVALNNENIQLTWETATETNNAGFNIERKYKVSSVYTGWETIEFMPGYGTSSSPKSYAYLDSDLPAASVIAYRLKQIDISGGYAYSKVDSVVLSPVTGIDDDAKSFKFSLSQNYPNPFNPSTKIKYTVPSLGNTSEQVELKIFDIIGNEVAQIVNESKSPGEYEVTFNAQGLPTGVYFYRISVAGNIETRKMILLK